MAKSATPSVQPVRPLDPAHHVKFKSLEELKDEKVQSPDPGNKEIDGEPEKVNEE